MDLAAHLIFEGSVDQTLTRNGVMSLEAQRHDERAEVPAAAGGTGVPGVEMAVVDDLDVVGFETFAKPGFDASSSVDRHGVQASARIGLARSVVSGLEWFE